MLRVLLFLLLSLCPATVRAADWFGRDLDDALEKARKELSVPGAAVVVVQDDKIVYLKAFGVREQGQSAPVSPDTVFPIASCSKAFTATLLAQLVDEGKLSWDDKVHNYMDAFRLSDPLADREATLRDLLCHRTGMPRHDMLWSGLTNNTEELIRRWCKGQPSTSFRSTYEYSNVPFTTAGLIAGALQGNDWGTSLEKRLLKPLGMEATTWTSKAGQAKADHATPHYHALDGGIKKIPWDDLDQAGGAGCINSTARDMAQWLRFQLAGGAIGEKRLLAEKVLKETHSPQVVVKRDANNTPFFPEQVSKFPGYGLGWFVSDYRSQMCVSHGGTLSGIRAQCMMLPEKKLGVFAVCNLRPSLYPETACRIIIDRVLGEPAEDWVKYAQEKTKAADERLAETRRKRADERKKDTKPSLALAEYCGKFTEPAYGTASLALVDDQFQLKWGKFTYRLEHHHRDTFTCVLLSPEPYVTMADRATVELHFLMGSNGEVVGLTVFGQAFTKVPPKK